MIKEELTIPVETAAGPRNASPTATFISGELDSPKQCHIGESQDFKDSITKISRQLIHPFTLKLTLPSLTQDRTKELIEQMATYTEAIPSNNECHPDTYYVIGIFNHAIWLLLALNHAQEPIRDPAATRSMVVMNNIIDLLVKKNHDYGNSFGNQLARRGSIVFAIRMEDKVSRLRTLINEEAQVKDESIFDTLNDIIGYCILFLHHAK